MGPTSTIQELSGYGAGNPVANNFKPTSREVIDVPVLAVAAAAGQYIFQAPWQCQVVGVRFNLTVISTGAATLSVERIIGDGVAPAAANGTTIILMTTATINLQSTVNTRQNVALSTAAGSPLILNAGDQLALFQSAASTGLAGANVQIEIAQIG